MLHRVFITALQFISVVYRCGQWVLNRLIKFSLTDIKCNLLSRVSFWLVEEDEYVLKAAPVWGGWTLE